MIHGLYTSAWGAVASRIRQEVVANNMANVNTPGFRADWASMRGYKNLDELRGAPPTTARQVLWTVGGGAMVAETRTSFQTGTTAFTGREADLAIDGDRNAFFEIERGGVRRYTRAGDFSVSPRGELVTSDGTWRLCGEGGTGGVNVGAGEFVVGRDGAVTDRGTGEVVGRVRVVSFDHPERLAKVEGAAFAAPEDAGLRPAAENVSVEQGYLEQSATNAAETMIGMIEALRSYEANMSFLKMHDQLLGRAVSEIARLGA